MKTVLITGASGNLGKASVDKFLRDGYQVIATITPGKSLGFEVAGNVETFEADLTDEKSVNDVLQQIVAKHKTIEAALLLVGGYASGGIEDTDGPKLRKMITQNFDTAYFVARPLFQHMRQQPNGGRLVFVGSRPGLEPKEAVKSIAYGLSKSLIFSLAAALNATADGSNVVSCVIVPSTIDTALNRQQMPKADFSKWVTPEEIANAMAYLCSDETKSWRGTVLKLFGGA